MNAFGRFWVMGLIAIGCAGTALGLTAEKNGIRVEANFKTLDRADGRASSYFREIDRTLTLRAVVKNSGFKPLPAGTVEWTVLIRRWGSGEIGEIEKVTGTGELKELKPGEQVELQLGEFQIGGHLHGTSKEHVDSTEGWRMVFVHGEKRTEILSSPSVLALEKRAGK